MTVQTHRQNDNNSPADTSGAGNPNESNIEVKSMTDSVPEKITNSSSDLVLMRIVDKEALPFVAEYMPKTMVCGTSDWVYRLNPESCEVQPRTLSYDGKIIFDVRTDGLHESGEPITIEEGGDSPAQPKELIEFEFEVGINLAFAATILFKQFKNTDRRKFVHHATEYLLSAGWTQIAIHFLFIQIAKIAGDNDIHSYHAVIQGVADATYKAGRSGLVDYIGEETVAAIEAPLRDVDELREDLYLDELKSDFTPSHGRSPSRFPPSELRASNPPYKELFVRLSAE